MPCSVFHDNTEALRYTLFFLIMFHCGDFIPRGYVPESFLKYFFVILLLMKCITGGTEISIIVFTGEVWNYVETDSEI